MTSQIIRPYGDTTGDGRVQVSFTLPVPFGTLAERARKRLAKLGCDNVKVMLGDGFDIPADAGHFDRILVTAAMEQIPESLTQRLEPGGLAGLIDLVLDGLGVV